MSKVTDADITPRRKSDHIRINREEDVQFPSVTTGLERYRFVHQALPELDLRDIDTSTVFLGHRLEIPLLISSMTGGTDEAGRINRVLAEAAQEAGIAMGLGSQRAALENQELVPTYRVRDVAPDILLMANLGAVQLNYGYGIDHCRRAVEMVGADALILHLNPLQEAVQPEGDVNFSGLLKKIEEVCRALEVPVVVKEVGWGLSERAARLLAEAGVAALDVAGAGGTSWSQVEAYRAPTEFHARIARSFADWGIPTAESIRMARRGAPDLPIIASGGLRTGIDIAKSIALGASLGGMARPFLMAASSPEEVHQVIREIAAQLRIAMFGAGVRNIEELSAAELIRV